MPQAAERPAAADSNWTAVAASAVCLTFSAGTLQLYSFGVFVRPLSAEFGWSRTGMSGAVALSQYALALSSPVWGLLLDRFGPRTVVLPSVLILGAMIATLSLLTPQLWLFYLLFGAVPILAGGASPLGYSAVMVRLFNQRLGLALGLALMGVGIGATLLPPLAQMLVGSLGWRAAYVALGALTVAVTLPAALVATRHTVGPARGRAPGDAGALLRAVRTRPFVLMCATFVLLGLTSIGTLAHLVPMLTDRGVQPAQAAQIAGLTGLAAVVGRGGLGWMLDRTHAPLVLAALSLLVAAAFLVLGFGQGVALGGLGAVLLGLVLGAEVDFVAFLVRRYFSPALFGRLYGLTFGLYLLGGGTGPILLGMSFDRTGSYAPGLAGFAVAGVAAAVLAATMPAYAGRQAGAATAAA